jgi:hypothetical protein
MKRNVLLVCSLLFIVQAFFVGAASARYNPQDDKTINIKLPITLPTTNIANLTFNIQEDLHQAVLSTTGIPIDHFYVWVNVNDQPIVAIDPAKAMF